MKGAVRLSQRDIATPRDVHLFYRSLEAVNKTDLPGEAPRGAKSIYNNNNRESFMGVNCIRMT